MFIVSNNFYSNTSGRNAAYDIPSTPSEGPLTVPRFRLGGGVTSMAQFRGTEEAVMLNGAQLQAQSNLLTKERMDIGQ